MAEVDPRLRGLTKPEIEVYYSYANDGDVYNAKILNVTGATAFVEGTVDEPDWPDAGAKLFAVLDKAREQSSEDDLVVTVNGWRQTGSAAISGTATFRARAAKGEAVPVVVPSDYLFRGISSVAITGGSSGEKVILFFLPATTTFAKLGFEPAIGVEDGQEYFNVAKQYDPADHQKRQRAENNLSLNDLYQNEVGFANVTTIKGFSVLLLEQQSDDGGSYVKQMRIFRKVKIEACPVPSPDRAGTDPLYVEATGNYSGRYNVGAPDATTSAGYIT